MLTKPPNGTYSFCNFCFKKHSFKTIVFLAILTKNCKKLCIPMNSERVTCDILWIAPSSGYTNFRNFTKETIVETLQQKRYS